MINLTGGNVQTLAGVAVPGGSLTLQLNGDAVVIATPGFVPSAYQRTFPFDSTGNLSGSCKLWSNAELNPPGTQYLVTFKDANGSRISNQIWQFTQSSGATVDIGTIIPVAPASSAASLPFSSVLANLLFGGPASGAAAFPSFRSLVAADIPALLNALQQFGATDTGLSRISAGLLGIGNGTQGDFSGQLKLAQLLAGTQIQSPLLLASILQQIAGSAFILKDSNGGTRYSIPLNGTSQATLNNTAVAGGSSFTGTLLSPIQGLAAVDTLVSPIVFSVHSLLNTGTNSGNFAVANAVAGTYEVGGYVYVSTAGSSGTVGLSFAYNNGANQAINSPGNANLGTLGSNAQIPTQIVQIAANTTFGWGATVTTGVGAFKYDVHLIVRRIN